MGDMLSGINSQVQMAKGNFAPTPVSVGDLFAGALLPGLLLVSLYLGYVLFKAATDPKSCPATPFQRMRNQSCCARSLWHLSRLWR